VSDDDEREPYGETASPQDPLGSFEAFRARRAEEQTANEPFPEQYVSEATAVLPPEAGGAASQFGAPQEPYGAAFPPPPGIAYPGAIPAGQGAGRGRGRLRSAVVLGSVAVLVVGLGVGVYAATQSSSSQPAASPAVTSSATASAGPSKASKNGKAVTAMLTVTAVEANSFSATTKNGATVSVHIATTTKFGTAARPFTRSQLVPGAVVYARLRHQTDGTVIATVIASATADTASASATASTGA
jgi:hypothetical protein